MMFKAALLFVTGVFATNHTNNTNNTSSTTANTTAPSSNAFTPNAATLQLQNMNFTMILNVLQAAIVRGEIKLDAVTKLTDALKDAPAGIASIVVCKMLAAMFPDIHFPGSIVTFLTSTARRLTASTSMNIVYVAQPKGTTDVTAMTKSLKTIKANVGQLVQKANAAVAATLAETGAKLTVDYVNMTTAEANLATATVVDPVAVVGVNTGVTTVTAAKADTIKTVKTASATTVSASTGIFAAAAVYLVA